MKNKILIASGLIAAFATAAFADRGMWLPAVGCIAWVILLAAARKKPREKRGQMAKDQQNHQIHRNTTPIYFQDKYIFWRD